MAKGFGEDLWKNVQAVKLGRDGGLEAPVRGDGEQGIRVGLDAVSKAAAAEQETTVRSSGRIGRWVRRLTRRS